MGDEKETTQDPVNNLALNPGPNAFHVIESLAFAKEAVTEAKLELAACEAELTKAKRAYAEIANWLEKN